MGLANFLLSPPSPSPLPASPLLSLSPSHLSLCIPAGRSAHRPVLSVSMSPRPPLLPGTSPPSTNRDSNAHRSQVPIMGQPLIQQVGASHGSVPDAFTAWGAESQDDPGWVTHGR